MRYLLNATLAGGTASCSGSQVESPMLSLPSMSTILENEGLRRITTTVHRASK